MAALRVRGIACRAFVAQVEGQEVRGRAFQFRHHGHLGIAHGEMHERPLGERQQRLGGLPFRARQAVEPILVDGVFDALREIRFQLHRGHGQAVQEQHKVDAVLVVQRVAHLPHHAQAVLGMAGQNVGIDRQRRFELGQLQRLFQA